VEAKIESLGLAMPNPAVPKGKFVNFVQIDNMVYLSGHLPQVIEFVVNFIPAKTDISKTYLAS
jgi:enamine deaminase RidA (YjgF/YER057c/UK114 family)